jgi:hypothetical protein
MKTIVDFLSHLAHFFLEWEMFQTKVVEKIKTHILCPVTVFRKSCRVWHNVEKHGPASRPQVTIWRMCIACWIPKATNTFRLCNTAFPPQKKCLHERASILRYTSIACLVCTFSIHSYEIPTFCLKQAASFWHPSSCLLSMAHLT